MIPLPKVFWPLKITSANQVIPIDYGGSISARALAVGTYTSAEALRAALVAGIQTAHGSSNWSAAVSATGRFSIANSALTGWTLRWASNPASTARAILGYSLSDLAATGTPATATAQAQHANGWYAPIAVRRDSGPRFDRTADRMTVALAGQNQRIVEGETLRRELLWQYLPDAATFVGSEGAATNEAIERWWRDGAARFRYWPDGAVEAAFADYFLDEETMQRFAPERDDRKAIWQLAMKLRGFVA